MCQSYVRLPRLFTSLAVAGMLGFGAHAAAASSAGASCRVDSPVSYLTTGAADEPSFTSPRFFWGRSRGDERVGAPLDPCIVVQPIRSMDDRADDGRPSSRPPTH